jgi:hypothetical protein
VLVARVGLTNRTDLPGAVANLRHSPAPILGSVLLRPQTVDGSYYTYGQSDSRPVLRESLLET